MPPQFARELLSARSISTGEARLLSLANISSAEMLASLLWNFPSIARRYNVDAPKLTNLALKTAPWLLAAMADHLVEALYPRPVSLGAVPPPGASFQLQDIAPEADPADQPSGSELPAVGDVDNRPNGASWPVRNQGFRGTCVSFAATAMREHLEFEQLGTVPDLSEQFLYHAIKTQTADPSPNVDGTFVRFAVDALAGFGVCHETQWPYNPNPIPGNVAQVGPGLPSDAATADALSRAVLAGTCQVGGASGNASVVLATLKSGRPVAVSLPVFADPLLPQGNNWNSPVGTLYGRVLDPPPTAVVVGGHAVCITGYKQDSNDPLGGMFVIRNSWGPALFGARLPTAGYHGPEHGYGQVSASYIDRYLWEFAQL